MKKNMNSILLLKLFLIGVVKYLKELIGTNSMRMMNCCNLWIVHSSPE